MADASQDSAAEHQTSSALAHENTIPHDGDPQDVHEQIMNSPSSPRITRINVLPPSPVILVPDTQPSALPCSRHTTPSLPAIECLVTTVDKTQDGSTTPEASLVDAATARPNADITTSNATPPDHYEVSYLTLCATTFNELDRSGST